MFAMRTRSTRIRVVLLLAFINRSLAYNSLQFESCLDGNAAPPSQQLNFDTVYGQFDQGQTIEGERTDGFDWINRPAVYRQNGTRLTGDGGKVMRLVLVGSVAGSSPGFSNLTNLLQTVVVSNEILFPVGIVNSSALCAAVRNPTGTVAAGGSGCPYGSGDIAVGVQLPFTSSYQLTTVSSKVVFLDASSPALTLACYNIIFTPYYPNYFAYNIIRYFAIVLLAAYLLVYMIARLYAAHTYVIHENETQLASSLTLKLSGPSSTRHRWAKVFYSAFASIRGGSLRRYVTPEFSEVFLVVMSLTLVGTVAVGWPDFVCKFQLTYVVR